MRAIENLINGNLTAAKKAARNTTFSKIMDSAHFNYGMTMEESISVAKYLKGEITWDQYCDKKKEKLLTC
jgi:hypothetical protein